MATGTATGSRYLRSPEVSPDYRLRVGTDSVQFVDNFNATTQNTNIWAYTFATMMKIVVGTATASQNITFAVTFDGNFE